LKEYDLGHVLKEDRYRNFIDHSQENLGNHPDFEIVSPLGTAFSPEIILMVDGCDTHFTDQITHMGLTLGGIRMMD
jgi:acetoin utilization deacetylase AcuC-like enzyme